MVIMDTLFDVISATIGAIIGAAFAFFLNRKRAKQFTRQSVASRQELIALRQENDRLLQQIKTKEDIILKSKEHNNRRQGSAQACTLHPTIKPLRDGNNHRIRRGCRCIRMARRNKGVREFCQRIKL